MNNKDGWGHRTQKAGKAKRGEKIAAKSKSGWGFQSGKLPTNGLPHKISVSYEVKDINIVDICIGEGRRALIQETVDQLTDSISVLGLREPVMVRAMTAVDPKLGWKKIKTTYVLVDGLHRLEALKRIGSETAPCFVMDDDRRMARMIEISTCVHRANVTELQRAEFITEWLQFVRDWLKAGQHAQRGGVQLNDKGFSKVAKELRVSREMVRRSEAIDAISASGKEAAKAAGLDDNQKALIQIAKEKSPERQAAKANEIAGRRRRSKRELSAKDNAALGDLIEQWCDAEELRDAFIASSAEVKERFIAHLRR